MKKKTVILILVSFILFLLLVFGVFKAFQYWRYINDSPYNILISDISPNSVTISWMTDIKTSSVIKIGDRKYEDSELTNIHRIRIDSILEFSDYSFSITDGDRTWSKVYKENGMNLSPFVINSELIFRTARVSEDILLPSYEEITADAYQLKYTVLFDQKSNKYSTVNSVYTNRFGGAVIDKNKFYSEERELFLIEYPDAKLQTFEYIDSRNENTLALFSPSTVFASEINCNQGIPEQKSNAISKSAFSDLATKWTAGRGKHYAVECYNDVIARAKAAGFDPAFALTIWLNESGASNYSQSTVNGGVIEDFGIHGNASVPVQDFNAQINYFLTLKFEYSCKGLTFWEAWGNMYRWGDCNENDPVKRQQGIDYYKGINDVYRLVTNGKSLPEKINGLEKVSVSTSNEQQDINGSICCALKINNRDDFIGDFENNIGGKSCTDIWKKGRSLYGGRLEYAVEIPEKIGSACEVSYPAVCCTTDKGVFWYPESACKNIVEGIDTYKECSEHSNLRACFLREGKYSWLSKAVGSDFIENVTTESNCTARNSISTFKITLNKGINLVGFDFNPVSNINSLLASDLISKNSGILLVGKFYNGEWSNLVLKSNTLPFSGDDFVLEQNNGYLIISESDIELSFDGWRDRGATYKELTTGWNLVGGFIYTNSGYAARIMTTLRSKGLDVDSVAKWDSSLGRFVYIAEDDMAERYGEDFRVNSLDGLFLRSNK